MKKYWVYIHTCPNGKKYVGCTRQEPYRRWDCGRGYKSQFFGKAILKYGWNNITHEIFEMESEEEMYLKEKELINLYHSNDPEYGYNCTEGGEGCPGHVVSEEARAKMKKAKEGFTGNKSTWKEGHIPWNKGKANPHSDEWRRKVSLSSKGRINRGPKSEEHRRHLSEAHKGKAHPQPTFEYLLPDGSIKRMMPSAAKRWYLNREINVIQLN